MSWLNKLERRLEPFAITNLTLYLVIGQAFVYLSALLGLLDPLKLVFAPVLLMHGEPWRLFTFIFLPPPTHWALIAFGLYFLWLAGSSLEAHWGVVRYNLFLLVGYLLTVGVSFLTPGSYATNLFIGGSILYAFAYLNPEFVIYIFMVIPVKIKWLALFYGASNLLMFVTGSLATKLAILAGLANFLIFFAKSIWQDVLQNRRHMNSQGRRFGSSRDEDEPRHRCFVCGKTDITDPNMDFRYCSKCAGDQCYCTEHIFNHEHVKVDAEANR